MFACNWYPKFHHILNWNISFYLSSCINVLLFFSIILQSSPHLMHKNIVWKLWVHGIDFFFNEFNSNLSKNWTILIWGSDNSHPYKWLPEKDFTMDHPLISYVVVHTTLCSLPGKDLSNITFLHRRLATLSGGIEHLEGCLRIISRKQWLYRRVTRKKKIRLNN